MNVNCHAEPCPVILSTACVFYEGPNLIYSGILNNDSLQTVVQKLDVLLHNIHGTSGTSGTNAALSAASALASKNAAKTSEDNSKTSETNAANSATDALASKNAAKVSEDNAKTSETNAGTSATNASNSAADALASKNAAKTSEDNAKTSETNAATSAASALASKNAAKTSEDNAAASVVSANNAVQAAMIGTVAVPAYDIDMLTGVDFTKTIGAGAAFTISNPVIKKPIRLVLNGGTLAPTFTGYNLTWILGSVAADYNPAIVNYLWCEIRSAGELYLFWGA